jgi:hypothetical protein
MENIRIIAREFREWLARHDPQVRVGWACSAGECPLAAFITERWRAEQVDVFPHGIRAFTRFSAGTLIRHDVPMTVWATDFIEHVDEEIEEEVSAGQALRILDTVTGGMIGEDGDPDGRQGVLLDG